MTKSRAPPAGVALAVQGVGARGPFIWGVLDGLPEDGLQIGAVCGVSSGAILGCMSVQGLVRGGCDGARAKMRRPLGPRR